LQIQKTNSSQRNEGLGRSYRKIISGKQTPDRIRNQDCGKVTPIDERIRLTKKKNTESQRKDVPTDVVMINRNLWMCACGEAVPKRNKSGKPEAYYMGCKKYPKGCNQIIQVSKEDHNGYFVRRRPVIFFKAKL
jgi:hypothetical protein